MYAVRLRIPSTRNNQGVNSDVVASAAIGSLGGAEPMTDSVESPFANDRVTGLNFSESPRQLYKMFQ